MDYKKLEINIALIYRTGGDYTMQDVYLIGRQIQKKKNGLEINVRCYTDITKVPVHLDNVTLLPLKYQWRGWWAKMNLFSSSIEKPCLYFDLDTAIISFLTDIIPDDKYQEKLIMLKDFYREKPASGMMWIPDCGKVQKVWDKWIERPGANINAFRGDQEFIGSIVRPDYYWQDIVDGIVSFKPNKIKRKILLGNEKVVCFHGKPRIREAANRYDWVKNYTLQNV